MRGKQTPSIGASCAKVSPQGTSQPGELVSSGATTSGTKVAECHPNDVRGALGANVGTVTVGPWDDFFIEFELSET